MLYTNEPQITSGTRLQSNYDLNKANTSGWYTVSTPKNGVSGLNAEKLFVIAPKNKNYITQFAFGDNDNLESMWFRSCANGTWSEWKEVATTDLYLAIAGGTITGDLTVKGNINGKFAGTPTVPDATDSSSDQQIANIKYVKDSISKLIDYSPDALDTLKELADAIGNDPNFAATMTSKLSEKFDKVGGQISGDVNVTGKIIGHLVGNADTATRAVTTATADKTQASISFKNPDGSNTSFNGNTAVDMTGGIYYAKESSHTVNADEATHAASATTVSAIAPVGQTKDLVSAEMAGSDGFRIRVGGTATDSKGNGYVSFDIRDDGNEPIYFRQYNSSFTSVIHQVTLLDGNGNTFFSGHVFAPTFNGNLVGNADNATNASHADKADNALYASVANHTDNSISFKNINGSNVSFNGAGAVDLTGGVYYAKESGHTINADKAGTAGTCTGNSATATSAAKLGRDGVPGNPMTFNWSGQSGQPSWLWGSNDGTNMYVWNPSNFHVAYADNATNATYSASTAGYPLLQRSRGYSVGDVVYSPSLASNIRLHCIKAGTTAGSQPGLSNSEGANITDGSVIWLVADVRHALYA